MFKKKVKKPEKPKRRFSFPFLISIPANFALSIILLISILDIQLNQQVDNKNWALFIAGFLAGFGLTVTASMTKFRVFVHEMKHSMVVNLSGNKVKKFNVGKDTGYVEYAMYEDRVHYAPLIALAPYFFPLFSLPTLIASIFIYKFYPQYIIPGLGFSLALDLCFSISEIHPNQTDFQSIIGGFLTSALYLAGFYIMWTLVCITMAVYGHEAFYHAVYLAINIGQQLWLKHSNQN